MINYQNWTILDKIRQNLTKKIFQYNFFLLTIYLLFKGIKKIRC